MSMAMAACDDAPALPPADTNNNPTDTSVGTDTAVGEDTAVAEDTATADTGEPGPDPNCNLEPKLSSLASGYFASGCAFSGCHGSSPAAGLDLRASGLHARLVGVAADNRNAAGRGKKLVVAGDPANSFLLQKVDGTHQRDEGFLMPDGAESPVDPGCRIFMLRKWIADGALDN
jgi:hypothetical protein